MTRLTLPQQRAQETRQRILDAARQVFARRGYGEATVEEIAAEAGVSNGALYHHFSSKEELFRAILENHMREHKIEIGALLPVSSFREAVERFAEYFLDHLQTDHDFGSLIMECWAQATRQPWARDAVAEFFRQGPDFIADILKVGQASGAVRRDLDVEAAALLLFAAGEGLGVMHAVDPERIDLRQLSKPWADLIERFVVGEGEVDMRKFQEGFEQFSKDQAAAKFPAGKEINT